MIDVEQSALSLQADSDRPYCRMQRLGNVHHHWLDQRGISNRLSEYGFKVDCFGTKYLVKTKLW